MIETEGIVVLIGRMLFAVFSIRSEIAHIRKHEGMTGYARSADSRSLGSAAGRPASGSGGHRVDRDRHHVATMVFGQWTRAASSVSGNRERQGREGPRAGARLGRFHQWWEPQP